jgi:diaminopimelate decarboxylase
MEGYSTGTLTSKFGIGLLDDPERLLRAFQHHKWLRTIHCHVGSQGVGIELAIRGIRATVDFALRVNSAVGHKQIHTVDIGGGLSVNFASDEVSRRYAHCLVNASLP